MARLEFSESRWRAGGGSEWPSQYEGNHSGRWPTIHHLPRWVPDRAGRGVVTICLRYSGTVVSEFTRYLSIAAARQAEERWHGQPCSPECQGRHVVAFTTPGQVHIEPSRYDDPVVPSDRAEALVAAGYHAPHGRTPDSTAARWPRPSALNPPLRCRHLGTG